MDNICCALWISYAWKLLKKGYSAKDVGVEFLRDFREVFEE